MYFSLFGINVTQKLLDYEDSHIYLIFFLEYTDSI
jgi:hypothetical protein